MGHALGLGVAKWIFLKIWQILILKPIALKITHKSGSSIHAALPLSSKKTSSLSPQIILSVYETMKLFPWLWIGRLVNETCEVARNKANYVCGGNSTCIDLNPNNGSGYRCNFMAGYGGNPYLKDGCQGIFNLPTLVSSHALCACNEAFYFSQKKKSLFYIYNFYFENIIYKWIKQFRN